MQANKDRPFTKAGMIIHGKNAKGEHSLIVPYTQGRFFDEDAEVYFADHRDGIADDRSKYYVMPKGSIEPGETVFDAAIRETHEETGIDLHTLLGSDNIDALRRGEPVVNYYSAGYPGVHVVRADPVPIDHTYTTRAKHQQRRMALFNVEVDALQPLAEALKNPAERNERAVVANTLPKVRESIDRVMRDPRRDNHSIPPDLETMLQWLRHGAIPPDGFHIGRDRQEKRAPYHTDSYQSLQPATLGRFTREAPARDAWFVTLESHYAPNGIIASRSDWNHFCDHLPRHDYRQLRRGFEAIDTYLQGRGIIGDHDAVIKLDDQDSPLMPYKEGSDIVSFEKLIGTGLTMQLFNRSYARAIFGVSENVADTPRPEQFKQSQFGALMAFARVRDITRGVEKFRNMAAEYMPMLKAGSAVTGSSKTLPETVDYAPVMLSMRDRFLAERSPTWASGIDQVNLGRFR